MSAFGFSSKPHFPGAEISALHNDDFSALSRQDYISVTIKCYRHYIESIPACQENF